MKFSSLPDNETAVLGMIRDADHAPAYDSILKRSGISADLLDGIISRLIDEKTITSFPEDAAKKREQRRYLTVVEMREAVEKRVADHLWELSAGGRLYFAYGSDLDPEEMYTRRCPGSRFLCRGRLEGFGLTFDQYLEEWQGTVASIKFSEAESSVWGVLYCIKPEDWQKLDEFEDVPRHNRRVRVPVHTAYGLFCAECYQSVPGDKRLPSKRYIGKIIRGAEFFGLPQKYIRLVKSLPVNPE
ncbi:MAG: gamma-glutamylcyclotransferase family protein [Bacillota bacterium]